MGIHWLVCYRIQQVYNYKLLQILGSYLPIRALEDPNRRCCKNPKCLSGGWLLLKKKDDSSRCRLYSKLWYNLQTKWYTETLDCMIVPAKNMTVQYDKIRYFMIQNLLKNLEEYNCFKNKIFTNDLQIHWNNLFFASLRYVFTEQSMLIGHLKQVTPTKHNIGELRQKVNFQNDNLSAMKIM